MKKNFLRQNPLWQNPVETKPRIQQRKPSMTNQLRQNPLRQNPLRQHFRLQKPLSTKTSGTKFLLQNPPDKTSTTKPFLRQKSLWQKLLWQKFSVSSVTKKNFASYTPYDKTLFMTNSLCDKPLRQNLYDIIPCDKISWRQCHLQQNPLRQNPLRQNPLYKTSYDINPLRQISSTTNPSSASYPD